MKKRLIYGVMLCGISLLTGCSHGQSDNVTSQQDTSAVYATEMPEEKMQEIKVFYSDSNAEFLISKSESINTDGLEEKDYLVQALQDADVLNNKVVCNSLKVKHKAKKVILDVDFNEEFQDDIWNMGSSGERMYIGSVVNTFLIAESADKMRITVNGVTLESGHTLYDKGLTMYPAAEETYLIGVLPGKQKEEVELRRDYCDIGVAYNYAHEAFDMHYDYQARVLSILSKKRDNKDKPVSYLTISPCEGTMEEETQRMMDQDQNKEYVSKVNGNIGQDQMIACVKITCDSKAVGLEKSYTIFEIDGATWKMEIGAGTSGLKKRLQLTVDSLEVVK